MTDYSIKRFNRYSDKELIEAAKKLSRNLKTEYISGNAFQKATGISSTTIKNRFGSWSNFCNKAGIKPVIIFKNTPDALFQNLDQVWEKLGKQPSLGMKF